MNAFMQDYTSKIQALCDALDRDSLESMCLALRSAYDGSRRIFAAGNGGSAATVNHFCCDLGKNAVRRSAKRVKIISLASSVEAITAVGNDVSFDAVFSEQLANLIEAGDVLLLVSASGNSPNIVRAAGLAKERGALVLGLTGLSGGKLRETADICVHVDCGSYEMVEDMHLMICHMIVCYFKSLDL